MSGYFSNFGKIEYTFENTVTNFQFVTNILNRSIFLKEIVDNTAISYAYQIKEEETPEIIADKYYGDATRHWIILLFNQIINPYYEFPLTPKELQNYIEKKYNMAYAEAEVTIHHYEMEIDRSYFIDGILTDNNVDSYTISEYEVDFDTGELTPRSSLPGVDGTLTYSYEEIPVTENQTLVQTYTIKAPSIATYETRLNESRRSIKLLDKSYVSAVENEFRRLMKNA